MKLNLSHIALLILVIISCDARKSVSQDLLTGLITKGDGISCNNVYLSDGGQKINRDTFVYGEKFYVNFEKVEGLSKSGDYVFPGMQLFVISQAGDTVLENYDLYANYTEGINFSPLVLQANIITADPMHSGNNYTLYINIWDKKGKGTYEAKMDFHITQNDHIKIESKNVSYDEIYLFSRVSNSTITDNNAKFNENIFLIFEGLEGFKDEMGKVYPGLSIKAKDAAGVQILNEEDLVGESGIETSQFITNVSPSVIFKDTSLKNPVSCEILIWDKRSKNSIKVLTKLNLE